MRALSVFFAASLLAPAALAAEVELIPAGATWSYLDTGVAPAAGWAGLAYDDSAWAAGPAQLGYGDGDEATVVSFGPDAANKYVTTWFRHEFTVSGASAYASLNFELIRDDGAVVHLNGVEVFRSNMPGGAVTPSTFASVALGGADESTWNLASAPPAGLLEGANVVAVELHQANPSSSDISFDLRLLGSDGGATLTRGPYLQLGTPDSVVVRWRSSAPTDSVVQFGASPASLTTTASDPASTTEHAVTLTGLQPNTAYYYSVGSSSGVLAGGDADHVFTTAPLAGTAQPIRIWALGDSGTADANAAAVRDAYAGWAGGPTPDLWLMLGDNAYNDGTDAQYQAAVFDMYPATLRSSVLWSTLGNHDGYTADSATQSGPYYDIFTLPTAGEAGGEPSGTEAYYSFDWGNIHFICLESYETDRSVGGAMLTWLEADLIANTADWTIAFWHHPPYSKGSHDSDTEAALVQMRQNALPILEDYGVDLVLAGHSHSYERSVLLDGHYGTSGTLQASMIVDGGNGRSDGDGAYAKATLGSSPHEGGVFVTAGSSGKISGGPLNHPAMAVSLNVLGSVVIDVDDDQMDLTFLDSTGAASDWFTIVKGTTACPPPTGAVCGNGLCEAGDGEDCLSCAADCNGLQSGKPSNRFCCGDGDGSNPLSCGDALCSTGGWSCTDTPVAGPSCCGDGVCSFDEDPFVCPDDCAGLPYCGDGTCDANEDSCSCAADCGAAPGFELSCSDGTDEDCDGLIDCADPDCGADPACSCLGAGAACTSATQCCSGSCRGSKNSKTCK